MIRLLFKRRAQVSDSDVVDEWTSLDLDLPEVEKLLDQKASGYGSEWFFTGMQRLTAGEPGGTR